jgi:hypothetical protein
VPTVTCPHCDESFKVVALEGKAVCPGCERRVDLNGLAGPGPRTMRLGTALGLSVLLLVVGLLAGGVVGFVAGRGAKKDPEPVVQDPEPKPLPPAPPPQPVAAVAPAWDSPVRQGGYEIRLKKIIVERPVLIHPQLEAVGVPGPDKMLLVTYSVKSLSGEPFVFRRSDDSGFTMTDDQRASYLRHKPPEGFYFKGEQVGKNPLAEVEDLLAFSITHLPKARTLYLVFSDVGGQPVTFTIPTGVIAQ